MGCGCGVLLAGAVGVPLFLRLEVPGLVVTVALVLICGVLGWRLGDSFFEKVLAGDPEGEPLRFWWHP